MTDLTGEFLTLSRHQLVTRRERIEACLGYLTDDQVWSREHETENAVGNLVLHLAGNVTQWILGGVARRDIVRDRAVEFSRREPLDRDELVRRLSDALREADDVVAGLTAADLLEPRRIQGYDVTVLHAVYHVVEHFAEHTGQIISATKRMTGTDLGFYADVTDGGNTTPDARP